jgi:ubiquinone/menaquinone biosynthesis C-methylase UbiE
MQKTRLVCAVALVVSLLPCCRRQPSQVARPSQPAPQPTAARPGADASLPAIECPLAKLGHAHLRPFEETEKYIAFLERADRAVWQRPDAVVAALGLRGNETVVDVGAGSGYFAFRFAAALSRGSVVASDIDPEMVRHMHHKSMVEGITNLRAVLGKADDPEIPPQADLVFVCDVLHHVADPGAWLGKLAGAMRPGARLTLIEFREGKLPEGPPEGVKMARAELMRLVTGVGLKLESDQPDLLPYQSFLIFRKPQG